MTAAKLVAALAPLALAILAACEPGDLSGTGVSATCSEIGARCQRPDGPLGVCQMTPCTDGREAPCWACTPQH